MNKKYGEIFNFRVKKAKQLENSSYFEELTGLIDKASSRIDTGEKYYFSSDYYLKNVEDFDSSYEKFIKGFKNSFENTSSDKVNIIYGKAGVGKTLFFNYGIQKLIRDENQHKDKYIKLGVDFKNIDSKKDVSYYVKFIREALCNNAKDAIRQLGEEDYNTFEEQYSRFCGNSDKTPHAMMYPVKFFSKAIFDKYTKPCIIILDNIDLACVETQKNVFKATANICQELHEFMECQDAKDSYRIYFAMRPETLKSNYEMRIGKKISFPLPNIQAICLEIIRNVLIDTANECDKNDKLKCEVTYYNIITNKQEEAKTYTDVANYFVHIFEHFFNELWKEKDYYERLGSNEEFHCYIVNYNIRTFLNFLIDTLSNGGFKPLTKEFNERQFARSYTLFDYIEMIIRGKWSIHPSNKNIDGEGGNGGPIIFNVFDTMLYKNIESVKVQHFMLNIRILQYFNMCSGGEPTTFLDLSNALEPFFDKENIKNAVKKLTFVHILYSYYEGDENISSKQVWNEVVINDNTVLELSTTGKFYLEKFICEFEYLYQMALSSIMPIDYVNELTSCWPYEKEKTVLRFLTGIFTILKENLESYDEETLSLFKETFCQDDDDINRKPYRRMLDSFILVMKKKLNKSKSEKTTSQVKLQAILNEAIILQKESTDYFSIILGDEI